MGNSAEYVTLANSFQFAVNRFKQNKIDLSRMITTALTGMITNSSFL